MLLALGPLTFGMSYTSMMPIVAREILHGGAPLQGFLLSCVGVGSLTGAIFIASQRRTHGYGLPIVAGAACFSLAIMGFGSSHWVPLSVVLGFCIGLFNVTYQTQNQTMLQLLTPREMRGRVMSIYSLDRGFVPLGAMLAGFLAATFGGEAALRIMGGIAFCIVVLVVATRPQFLKLKVPFILDGEGAERMRHSASRSEESPRELTPAESASRP
jgi:MFS family permease